MPDWGQIAAFISGTGFSVFVAVWFMVKHDRRLSELTSAIRALQATLDVLYRLASLPRPGGMGVRGGQREE